MEYLGPVTGALLTCTALLAALYRCYILPGYNDDMQALADEQGAQSDTPGIRTE